MPIKKKQVKQVSIALKNFTFGKDSDYLTVTEWTNGEGWDIDINGKVIPLHSGVLVAINYLTTMIDYDY